MSERQNYSVFHAVPFHGLAARFGAAGSGAVGELFLADLLGLSGQEVVLVHMPPGGEILVDHTNGGHEELVVCVCLGRGSYSSKTTWWRSKLGRPSVREPGAFGSGATPATAISTSCG